MVSICKLLKCKRQISDFYMYTLHAVNSVIVKNSSQNNLPAVCQLTVSRLLTDSRELACYV